MILIGAIQGEPIRNKNNIKTKQLPDKVVLKDIIEKQIYTESDIESKTDSIEKVSKEISKAYNELKYMKYRERNLRKSIDSLKYKKFENDTINQMNIELDSLPL